MEEPKPEPEQTEKVLGEIFEEKPESEPGGEQLKEEESEEEPEQKPKEGKAKKKKKDRDLLSKIAGSREAIQISKKDLREIAAILEDLGGDDPSADVARSYGYIEDYQKMRVPLALKEELMDINFDNQKVLDGLEEETTYLEPDWMLEIIAANVDCFSRVRTLSQLSVGCAYIRAMLISKGYLYCEQEDRRVFIDEVVWYDDDDAPTVEQVNAVATFLNQNPKLIQRLRSQVRAIASFVEIIFNKTNHHYRQNYEKKYFVLFASCLFDDTAYQWISEPAEVFRTAVHPFGMYAFYMANIFEYENQTMLRGASLRMKSPSAGVAKPCTAYAAVKLMLQMKWGPEFRDRFKNEIDSLADMDKRYRVVDRRYHQMAVLYGYEKNYELPSDELAIVATLAPYIMAFIDAYCEDAPIAGQQTLTKLGDDNPGLKAEFRDFLLLLRKDLVQTRKMSKFLRGDYSSDVPVSVQESRIRAIMPLITGASSVT